MTTVTNEQFADCAMDMADKDGRFRVAHVCALLNIPLEDAVRFTGRWSRTPVTQEAIWKLNGTAKTEAEERENQRLAALLMRDFTDEQEPCLEFAHAQMKDGKFNFRDISIGQERPARQLVKQSIFTLPDADGLSSITPEGETKMKRISRIKLFRPE